MNFNVVSSVAVVSEACTVCQKAYYAGAGPEHMLKVLSETSRTSEIVVGNTRFS